MCFQRTKLLAAIISLEASYSFYKKFEERKDESGNREDSGLKGRNRIFF